MKYGEILKSDKIASSVRRGLKQSAGAVRKGAMVVQDKTGYITWEGVRQLVAPENRSKKPSRKSLKKLHNFL
jgi:hypothetical protein